MSSLSEPIPDPEFEALIRLHRTQLYAHALSLVTNRSDAEDVLQQSCVVLWEKRDQFEAGTNFLAWARQIIRYQASNHRRREAIRTHAPLLDDHLMSAVQERSEEREREYLRHRRALQICLQLLPERQRTAIEMRYLDGKPMDDLCAVLNLKHNAVSQILHRARAGLIACVQTRSHGLSDSTV